MDVTVDVSKSIEFAKSIFKIPNKFFKDAKKDKNWKMAFSFMLVISFIGHILTALYNLLIYPLFLPVIANALQVPETTFNSNNIIPAVVISYLLTLGMSFVWGGGLKVWLSLFKIDSTFDQAYKVMVYSRTPNYLLSWVPFVNILAAIYSFYLMMLGLEIEYGVARKRSIIIVISSLLAVFAISLLVVSVLPSV